MPSIIINVAGEAPGSPGVAREFVYGKIDPTPPLVTLSLDGDAGITQWFWEILDQPSGASAVLGTPTLPTATFTPTVAIAGTYLVRCTINGGSSYATNAVAWTTENLALRIPAAGETIQYSTLRGWALATEKALRSLDALGGGTGIVAGAGLTITDLTINIGDGTIGDVDGIAIGDDGIGVAVDGTTLEVNLSEQVQVKDAGITAAKVDLSDDFTFTGEVAVPTPTENAHAATKEYVDQKVQGLEWQDSVIDRAINTPPAATEGDRYIIGDTPTGVWVGHAEEIAEFTDPNWEFTAKKEGLACWVDDENTAYVYNGTAWVKLTAIMNHNDLGSLDGGGSGEYYHLLVTEHTDVVNKLGDLGYKQSLAPGTNLTKGDGSPWTTDQVDDASTAVGDILYIAADGNWERADANAKATAVGFGLALEAGAGSKKILLPGGVFRNDAWSWTPGAVLYVSAATVGAMTHTPPSGSGDYVVPVAVAKTATVIILCPSLTLVKLL